MGASRPAAGPARGALHGVYPEPGVGLTCTVGVHMKEEGLHAPWKTTGGDLHGDLGWSENLIAGGATFSHPTPGPGGYEMGLLRVVTSTNAGDGGSLVFPAGTDRPFAGSPPPGTIWVVKIRAISATDNQKLWSGFSDVHTDAPDGGFVQGFIGVYADSTTPTTWKGRIRTGGADTDVDLGLQANVDFAIMGFEHKVDILTGLSAGIQWFIIDSTLPYSAYRQDIGDPIDAAYLPIEDLSPVLIGVMSAGGGGARDAEVDYYELAGRSARGGYFP